MLNFTLRITVPYVYAFCCVIAIHDGSNVVLEIYRQHLAGVSLDNFSKLVAALAPYC